LIGDNGLDEYQYGTVDRISPEAPVPVFVPGKTEMMQGMAANVENNLATLGLGVVSYFGEQSVKVRIIDSRSGQHLLRIDHDKISPPIQYDHLKFDDVDAIVVSDYNKGTVTYRLIEDLLTNQTLPIFVDTKKTDLAKFNGCYLKINEMEYKGRISDSTHMIVTHGGSHVHYGDRKYAVPNVPVFDVCGAGDTFLAALVYQYLHTNSMDKAIQFAIAASTVTVQHLGVYAPTLEEIKC
jgi:D-beta-D-heptose 7-phosphate kinase/D-beta-D-heptose 1-phosphate adenosyltransferase